MAEKRQCYYISGTQPTEASDGEGFIPSLVTKDEPGHQLMSGNSDELQAPWVWGPSLEEAHTTADIMNEMMGITKKDAAKIVASSMAVSEINQGEL